MDLIARKRLVKAIIISGVIFVAGVAYALFVMHFHIGIPCPVNLIFRIKCPGCGISRFIINCMKFDFKSAIGFNYAGPFICLFLADIYIDSMIHYVRNGKTGTCRFNNILSIVILPLFVMWGILRNFCGI